MVAGLRFAGVHDYNNYVQVISEVSELYDKPFLDIFDFSNFPVKTGLIGSPCKNLKSYDNPLWGRR